jgi:hypothetical protein
MQHREVNNRRKEIEVNRFFNSYENAMNYFNSIKDKKHLFKSYVKGRDCIVTTLLDSKQVLELKRSY